MASGGYSANLSTPFLKVVYQDDYLLVLDKPSGLLSVPGRGADKQDCLSARAQSVYSDALVVHRLDEATSGLVLMARGKTMQAEMSRQFRERIPKKDYIAVVSGLIEPDSGEMNWPLICDWENRPRQKVDYEIGKPSLTEFEVISRDVETNTTRVRLYPITGRSHQLRVHLQQLGHPILGDDLYADEAARNQSPRLCLHAHHLSILHPVMQEWLTFEASVEF